MLTNFDQKVDFFARQFARLVLRASLQTSALESLSQDFGQGVDHGGDWYIRIPGKQIGEILQVKLLGDAVLAAANGHALEHAADHGFEEGGTLGRLLLNEAVEHAEGIAEQSQAEHFVVVEEGLFQHFVEVVFYD